MIFSEENRFPVLGFHGRKRLGESRSGGLARRRDTRKIHAKEAALTRLAINVSMRAHDGVRMETAIGDIDARILSNTAPQVQTTARRSR